MYFTHKVGKHTSHAVYIWHDTSMMIWYMMCIIILYYTLSTSQSEWIAMVPSSLTFDNSPKRRCSLWIHDVPYLYPIALQGYPTHFIVMYMYRPHHLGEAIYQSKVISNEDICCGRVLLNDAPPYQPIRSIPSRNKIYQYFYTRRAYTNR